MRKEIVWVAGIGIILGLIFAFGVYRINSSLPKKVEQGETPKPDERVSQEFQITLNKPEEGDVVIQDSVEVNGLTKAGAFVVISGEDGDYIIESGPDGTFSEEVDLNAGVNQIKISAFDAQGEQSTTKVIVVYSSVFEPKTFETSTSENASQENDIRDKVAQKVAEALNKPKAYLGTVTDIADSTIQIKSIESEIMQISIGEGDIDVVNTKGTNNKTVEITDVAIGDFIVAMGYVNSNAVLSAQRILITDAVSEPTIKALMAKVTDTGSDLSVSEIPEGTAATVELGRNTNIFELSEGEFSTLKLSNISEGDTIIYVLDTSTSSPSVRSIFRVATAEPNEES